MPLQSNSRSPWYIVSSRTYYILLMRSGIPLNSVRLFLQFLLSQTILILISTLQRPQTPIHSISCSLGSLHIFSLVLRFTLVQSQSLSLFYLTAISTIDYSFPCSYQQLDLTLCISITILTHASHMLTLHNLTHNSSSIHR